MRKFNVHIKPTKKCNLKCRYCFEMANHDSPAWLDLDKLEHVLRQISVFCQEIGIEELGIHYSGGEVFVLGSDYWAKAMEMQKHIFKKNKIKVTTHFQTNLTLLDNGFIHLIKKYGIKIGTSLDPFSITRPFRSNGESSSPVVIDNLVLLARNKIKSGLIVVLTRENYRRAGEILELFHRARVGFHVLSLMQDPQLDNTTKKLVISGAEYGEALVSMLKSHLAIPLGRRLPQPSLDSYIQNVSCGAISEPASICTFEKHCLNNRVFIENDGNVYPCDSLRTKGFYLGNIFKSSFLAIVNNFYEKPVLKKLEKRYTNIQKQCRDCQYVNLCNGGCVHYAFWEGNPFGKSEFYCQVNKKVYGYLSKNKKAILNQAE